MKTHFLFCKQQQRIQINPDFGLENFERSNYSIDFLNIKTIDYLNIKTYSNMVT